MQKVQIFLEELADVYGTEWTTTLMYISIICDDQMLY
jgi:glutathione S-transferase